MNKRSPKRWGRVCQPRDCFLKNWNSTSGLLVSCLPLTSYPTLNQDTWYGDKPDITKDNLHFFLRYLENRKQKLDREWG